MYIYLYLPPSTFASTNINENASIETILDLDWELLYTSQYQRKNSAQFLIDQGLDHKLEILSHVFKTGFSEIDLDQRNSAYEIKSSNSASIL